MSSPDGNPINVQLQRLSSRPQHYTFFLLAESRVGVAVATQNFYDKGNGAYTDGISVEQLKDVGITWFLLVIKESPSERVISCVYQNVNTGKHIVRTNIDEESIVYHF